MFDSLSKAFLVPGRFYSLFDVLMIAIIIMALLLKVAAARRAWKNNQKVWFWLLIFVNTLGVFEMIYLLCTQDNCPRKKINIIETEVDLSAINQEKTPKKTNPRVKKVIPPVEIPPVVDSPVADIEEAKKEEK